MARTIYFVRHGESEHNKEQVVQDGENSLSELGAAQAQKLAQRFERIKIDQIFSSTYQRALETAQTINERIKVPLQVFEQLRETQIFPSRFIGQLREHPDVEAATAHLMQNRHTPGWRFEDAENFSDRVARASSVLELIASSDVENLLVVSHGGLIKTMMACILFGKQLDSKAYYYFMTQVKMSNAGITVCEYSRAKGWQLVTWNDQAHLGE